MGLSASQRRRRESINHHQNKIHICPQRQLKSAKYAMAADEGVLPASMRLSYPALICNVRLKAEMYDVHSRDVSHT